MRLLAMSGFVPEQICDVVRFTGCKGERNISYYCGYANDYLTQVLNDPAIDGAVFPRSCDSTRIIKNYLANMDKFIYQITVPACGDEPAIEFLAKEIERYKIAVEDFFQEELNDIPARIHAMNKRNADITDYYKSLEDYSYGDYLRWIHGQMEQPLMEQSETAELSGKGDIRKRVYLVGSFLTNEHIADLIEENGLGIVGDNLPESGRLVGSYTDENESDIYKAISSDILSRRLSPTQDNFQSIIQRDLQEIRNLKADAVIFLIQKYCEPYDYLYSAYKKELDRRCIPSLKMSLISSMDEKKAALSVEAFAEMI